LGGKWYEEEGLWFRGPVCVRRETLGEQTNEVIKYWWTFDPEGDLTVAKTGTV